MTELGRSRRARSVIDGFLYRTVTSVTLAPTAAAGATSSPTSSTLNLNHRFSPDTTLDAGQGATSALVGGRAEIVVARSRPSALPHAEHPLVGALRESGVVAVEPKQAWTDVARFAALGVPAVNFGPGENAQAHQRNEWTSLALLHEGYAITSRWLLALGPSR